MKQNSSDEEQSACEINSSKDVMIVSLMTVYVELFCAVVFQRMISKHFKSHCVHADDYLTQSKSKRFHAGI